MSFLATTTVTILRGEATGHYGDDADADTVVATGLPASILEKPASGGRPTSGRTDTPRTYTLRVLPRRDADFTLRQTDRVRDERTGLVYVVDTQVNPRNPVGHTVTRYDLRRVT